MRLLWKLTRGLLILLVLSIVGLVIWFTVSSYYDEPLAPGLKEFFYSDAPVPDAQNGYIAMAGLDAPTPDQMIRYGLTNEQRYKHFPENYSYLVGLSSTSVLTCWVEGKVNIDPSNKTPCLSPGQLRQVLTNNRQFLQNYEALYRYPRFVSNRNGVLFGGDLITLHTLKLAQLTLQASDGDAAKAMQGWIQDTQFVQRLIADQQQMVPKAIFMALYNQNVKSYPLIAARLSVEQLALNRAPLEAIFKTPTFGPGGWDMAATMRAEHRFLFNAIGQEMGRSLVRRGSLIWYKPQATENGFYAYARDLVDLSHASPRNIWASHQALTEKYARKKDIHNPVTAIGGLLYNVTGKLLLGGVYVSSVLLTVAANNYDQRQMLNIYTQARIQQVPLQTMGAFVQPFTWDAARNTLHFTSRTGQRFAVEYEPTTPAPSARR